MALKQRTATGKYVKLKDGKFYLSTDKENKEPFDELEGTLVDVYFKDETYENQVQRKLYLVMNDGDDNLIVGMRADSRYATGLLRFLPNVDLNKPFSIIGLSKEKADASGKVVTESTLLVSQFGSYLKAYFTKDNPNGLPQMKQVKVNGKPVWDKSDMLEFFEDYVTNKVKPQLKKVETKSTVLTNEAEDVTDGDEDPVNDLPWEND